MKNLLQTLCGLFLVVFYSSCMNSGDNRVDVLIVGGGASGVTSGIQAARMGANTLILEETTWLGGMLTSAGVSAVDGNYRLPAGLWGEFKNRLSDYYGGLDSLKTGWVSNVLFEPSVGNKIFHEMVSAEKNLKVWKQTRLEEVKRVGDEWIAKVNVEGQGMKTVRSKVLNWEMWQKCAEWDMTLVWRAKMIHTKILLLRSRTILCRISLMLPY